ncbi:MAG: hypothetical protein HY784_07635, partial [Chloroflexi bacterium]|nr:hypothetical protein [Chloroflexota bacterium]
IDEARARSKDLLELKRLGGQVDFNIADTPLEKGIRDLEAQVRDLQSQVAQQTSQQQELTRARDLAWSTYTNLATKEAELGVAAQTTGVEVALAAPAAVPDQDTMSGALNVAIATVLGLMLGVLAAYVIEYWQGYKGLELQPVPVFAIMRSWGGAASSRVRPAATEKAVVESAPLEEKPGPAGAGLSTPPSPSEADSAAPGAKPDAGQDREARG